MANSYVTLTGDGSTSLFTIPFGYIAIGDISVTVGGVLQTGLTFPTASTVQLLVAPALGAAILIRRNTNANVRAVVFADASTLTGADLNRALLQNFYLAQEIADGVTVLGSGTSTAVLFGILASRPAFGVANRLYCATDTLQIFEDTGGAWILFSPSTTMVPVVQSASLEAARSNLGNVAGTVDTIAALKAITAPVSNGAYLVRGYTTAGDGAGGDFLWNAADTTADNAGTVIQLNSGGTGRFNKVLGARDSITLEEFGGGASVASNTAALNNCVAWATARAIKKIKLRAGNYTFNTKPNNFTDGVVIEGVSSSQTNLIRNYTASSPSEGFLTWYQGASNGGGCKYLGVIAADGTSNGTMLMFLTGGQVSGYHHLYDVVISHFGTGDYYTCFEVNGIDNTTGGSQGMRDFRATNCFFFLGNSGSNYTFRLLNATNHTIKGCWTNGPGWVTGGGTALTNTTVGIIDMISISSILVENCTRVKLYGEFNTITLQANADTIDLYCRVTTSLTDFGATNVFKDIAQSFANSLATNGYMKLPGGMIMQWGTFAATTSFSNFTFPIAFPTACTAVVPSAVGASGTTVNVVVGSFNTTVAGIAASTAGNVHVIAFGY